MSRTVGNDFFLKTGNREMLMKHIKVARELDKLGFVSSLPIPTRSGDDYPEGQDLFVLTRRLKGSTLPGSDRFGDYRIEFGENFGKLYDKLPKQLIHRDPNPSNILFESGEVSGFIDFDLSEVNVRLWDACYCATGILSESSDELNGKWLDILGGILHGYDREGYLISEEKQAVFYVICSIQMIFIAYCESREELKQLAKTNRKMFKFIVDNKSQINQMF